MTMSHTLSSLSKLFLTGSQIIYRLNKCGELCFGIFSTIVPGSEVQFETLATGKPVESNRENAAISVLLAHVIATKATSNLATDDSMAYPVGWDSEQPPTSNLGHQDGGRTIVLHSVAVLPQLQGRGLGKVLMKAYMQQMSQAGIADRLALIAHDVSTFVNRLTFSFQQLVNTIS